MRKRQAAFEFDKIEGNSEEWSRGDSGERKPILVIPFSSPPFGLWMEEARMTTAATVKGIFGMGRERRRRLSVHTPLSDLSSISTAELGTF